MFFKINKEINYIQIGGQVGFHTGKKTKVDIIRVLITCTIGCLC